MAAHVVFVVISWLCLQQASVSAVGVHKRFEYKQSFKGPHLVQQDGTIPFWEHSGHAIASDESIRITPSLRSKKGQVWSKVKNTNPNWEIEVTFRISGRGRIGADGLAIWYTTTVMPEGPVFGSADKWNGLGLFFDSFDNDNQHNNPYILAMVNDGMKQYDHNTDGSNQQLGGCLRDFRNKPFPVRAKVEYFQKTLTVFVHSGMSNNKEDYEMCLRAENVELPAEGFFGVTAATGGLADDHDVTSFLTHSLTGISDSTGKEGQEVSEDERKKFEKEFDEYYQKLQKAKEDYKKEHPDQKPGYEDYDEDDRFFESMDERQLKMIFDGQTAIHQTMRELHRKLDEVVGRQERTMSQISLMGTGSVQPSGTGSAGGTQQVVHLSAIQSQIDVFNNNHRDIQNTLRDYRNILDEIKRNPRSAGTGAAGGFAGEQTLIELRNSMNGVQQDLKNIMANKSPGDAPMCPPPPPVNCVSTFYMFVFLAVQVAAFIGYSVYRSSKDAAAKKFY